MTKNVPKIKKGEKQGIKRKNRIKRKNFGKCAKNDKNVRNNGEKLYKKWRKFKCKNGKKMAVSREKNPKVTSKFKEKMRNNGENSTKNG